VSLLTSLFLGFLIGVGLSWPMLQFPGARTELLIASIVVAYAGTAGIGWERDSPLLANLLLPLVVIPLLVLYVYSLSYHPPSVANPELAETLDPWWVAWAGVLAGAGYTLAAMLVWSPGVFD
jgi:hypothetical protein